MQNLIHHTNTKIANWYSNAKKDFGITGEGSARIENDTVIVDYTENGEQKTWSMPFFPEYAKTQTKDFIYLCWSESAN